MDLARKWKAWPLLETPVDQPLQLSKADIDARKIIDLDSFILVLTSKGNLLRLTPKALLPTSDDEFSIGHQIKDVCVISKALKEGKESNEKELLVITEEEDAYILDPESMSIRCQLKTSKMSSCTSGSSHLVLLDTFGSVWTAGAALQASQFMMTTFAPSSAGQDKTKDLQLNRIEYFQGQNVLNVCSGSDFTVALVRRVTKGEEETSSSATGYKSSCPLGLPIDDEMQVQAQNQDRQ